MTQFPVMYWNVSGLRRKMDICHLLLKMKTPIRIQRFDRVSNVSLLENELVRYDALAETEVDVDPLIWCKANAGSFKCLSILARKYLCVAATSVASERVFSTSGNIVCVIVN